LKEPAKAIEAAKRVGLELKKGPLMEEFWPISSKRWSSSSPPADLCDPLSTEVSLLSRRNAQDPEVVDRFELFMAGRRSPMVSLN